MKRRNLKTEIYHPETELRTSIINQNQDLLVLRESLKETQEKLNKTENLLTWNREELRKVITSKRWFLISNFFNLIDKILRPGSRQRHLVGKVFKLGMKVLRKGVSLFKKCIYPLQFYIYVQKLEKSGLFDDDYYIAANKNLVKKDHKYLIHHYIKFGYKDGYNPSERFDNKYYLLANPRVKNKGIPPIIDYLKKEKFNPLGNFNLAEYLLNKFDPSKPTLVLQLESFDKGGLEEVVLSMGLSQSVNNKYNVVILVTGNRLGHLAEVASCKGIPVIAINHSAVFLSYLIVKLNVTVCHLHYSIFGLETYNEYAVKTIYTIHNNYIWLAKDEVEERKISYKFVDSFIAVSSEVREYFIKKFGIDPKRVKVIPNGVEPELLDNFSKEKREDYQLDKKDFVLINVSSFIANKFHPLMVVAMSKLVKKYPRLKLVLVGNILDQNYFDQVVAMIKKYDLEKNVFIINYVPKHKLLGLLNLSNCFILPSLTEGFSISAIEAMYFKLPMILSDVGGAREVIKNDDIGLIIKEPYEDIQDLDVNVISQKYSGEENLNNLDDLVVAITDMYENRRDWKEKAKLGRQKVNEIFNINRMASEYVKAFEETKFQSLEIQKPLDIKTLNDGRMYFNNHVQDFIDLPLVSILLPVYNHIEYVVKAIDSVREQTYPNWELVILDDGSTDGLLNILERYSNDSRIRVYTQKNQKLPRTLHHLHKFVKGSLITWTSADNILEPKMLDTMVRFLIKHPDCALCYGDVIIIDEDGNYFLNGDYRNPERDRERPYIIRLPRDASVLGIDSDNFINASFLYRRDMSDILDGEYAADLRGLEDFDYWLRLARLGKILHIHNEEPLYRYRVHKNTMSEELLTVKRNEHIARIQKFIEYEHARMAFAAEDFNVIVKNNCNTLIKSVDIKSRKTIVIDNKVGDEQLTGGEIHVGYDGKKYIVPFPKKRQVLVSGGYDIPKMDFFQRNIPSIDERIKERQVIGIHCEVSKIFSDEMREIIQKNPESFFVFYDINNEGKNNGTKIVKGFENAVYEGKKAFGSSYINYAYWNAIMIPPMDGMGEYSFDDQKILAWTLERYLVYPKEFITFNVLPLTLNYDAQAKLPNILSFGSRLLNGGLISECINKYSISSRFNYLKKVCNISMENKFVERPDFKEELSKEVSPKLVKYPKK